MVKKNIVYNKSKGRVTTIANETLEELKGE